MKRSKFVMSILALCLLVSMLAGCASAPQATSQPSGATSAPTSAPKVTKDSVTVAAAAEADAFFPFHSKLTTNMDEVPILHNIYETPIRLEADGSLTPLLAKSWKISDDGKDYTLNLRDDVKFHDGNKMTADDVAFTLNGAAATSQGKAQLGNYDKAEALNPTTVVVHLKSPFGPFMKALAGRYALVVEKALFEKVGEDGYHNAPVGTGPYKWVSRVPGNMITLVANDSYWGAKPAIKNVVFKVMTDTNTQMLALEKGEVDVLINANISPLVKLPKDGPITWAKMDAAQIAALLINVQAGTIGANKDFRKALQYGINKKDIIIGVYEGLATEADLYMAPSFSGRPDAGSYNVVAYDKNKAKELLKSSGYKGEEFKIVTVAGTKNEAASQIIQGQLIELGINATLSALDAASYSAATTAGTYNASLRAGGVSLMDADGVYYVFHSSQLKTLTFPQAWSTPELDTLLDQGRTVSDPTARKAVYVKAVNIITENVLHIPVYYDLSVVAYNKSIKNVVPRALVGLYFFNDWSW
jgi:peptide/nickel transport system substrate-binding protein